jgi:hypothetical protein
MLAEIYLLKLEAARDFGRFVANDIEKWGKVVKFAGLKPD